jgi:hypothetical protein
MRTSPTPVKSTNISSSTAQTMFDSIVDTTIFLFVQLAFFICLRQFTSCSPRQRVCPRQRPMETSVSN